MTPFFTVASRAALAPGRLAAAGSLVGRVSSSSSSSRFVAMAPRVAPFSSSVRASAGSGPPVIQGEGAKPGEMPTDENQSTGLERLELLGRLEGVDVFDMEPLESHRKGTLKEPINVKSLVSVIWKEERGKNEESKVLCVGGGGRRARGRHLQR